MTGPLKPQSFRKGLDDGILGPHSHPDSGQPEGNRLQGGLAKPQASGKLYFTHITLCLGQEYKALRG